MENLSAQHSGKERLGTSTASGRNITMEEPCSVHIERTLSSSERNF